MEQEEKYESVLKAALKKLQATDKFEAELRQALAEFDQANVDLAIDDLKRRKLLDDRRTTLNLIERRSGKRSLGTERLRAELLARGAPEDIVDECLAATAGEDQAARMKAALAGKFSPGGDRAKGARFLLGRGFAEDEIEAALDDFFQPE